MTRKYYLYILAISCLSFVFTLYLIQFKNLNLLVNYINDSVGHLTTARHIVDDHKIETSFIYLITLNGDKITHLYMPGYHVVLAFFYWLFGVNLFSTLLPNFIAYCGTSLLVFYVANKRYGEKVGFIAAAIFALIPCNIILSMMAMTEMTLTFVVFLSFTIFYMSPLRVQYFLMPVLIVVCYLFRQTTILLMAPFVLQMAYHEPRFDIKKFLLIILSMAATLYLVQLTNTWQMHEGLKGLDFRMLLSGGMQYDTAYQQISTDSIISLLITNVLRNFHTLWLMFWPEFQTDGLNWYYLKVFVLFLCAIIVASIKAYKRITTDFFPVATALMSFGLFVICITLNTGHPSVIVRIVMYTMPFLAIVVAKIICDLKYEHYYTTILVSGFVVLIALLIKSGMVIEKTLSAYRSVSEKRIEFFTAIQPSTYGILVAPHDISMEWVLKNYPLKYTFVPGDVPTLELIAKKYKVTTVVLRTNDLKKLSHKALQAIGLVFTEQKKLDDEYYYIYRAIT